MVLDMIEMLFFLWRFSVDKFCGNPQPRTENSPSWSTGNRLYGSLSISLLCVRISLYVHECIHIWSITYSTLIDGLCKNGRFREAIELFEEMVSKDRSEFCPLIQPSSFSFMCMWVMVGVHFYLSIWKEKLEPCSGLWVQCPEILLASQFPCIKLLHRCMYRFDLHCEIV